MRNKWITAVVFILCVSLLAPAGPVSQGQASTTSAQVLSTERVTQGNWVGVYGGDGYVLPFYSTELTDGRDTPAAADVAQLPNYVSGYSKSGTNYWTYPPNDPRALQTPDGTSRKKVGVYVSSAGTYSFDLNDSDPHLFTVYATDFGNQETVVQRLDILDAQNQVLATQTLDTINQGVYVTFQVSGDFKLRITRLSGNYGYALGMFFDEPVPVTTSNLTLQSLGNRKVQLDWDDSASTAVDIFRKRQGDDAFLKIGEAASGITTYLDENLEAGVTYEYALLNVDGQLRSVPSSAATITLPAYAATQLTFDDAELTLDAGETVSVGLTFESVTGSSTTPLSGKAISFHLEGPYVGQAIPDTIGTATTDANGKAAVSWTAAYAGEYEVVASIAPDDINLLSGAEERLAVTVLSEAWEQPPIILRASEAVKAGEVLSLYGGGMTELDTSVWIEALTGASVPSAPSSGAMELTPAQQESGGDRFVRVVIPDTLAHGMYAVWVENAYGLSDTVVVNGADPRWLPDGEAFAGMNVRLIGRQLDAAEFGGTTNTEVRLVNTVSQQVEPVTIVAVSPYALDFDVGSAPAGEYAVEVRNGSNVPWSRLAGETLTVVNAGANPDPLGLNVSWAKDFNWTQVRDIKVDYSAAGDGVTNDTTAIQTAIDDIADDGGGVLLVPAGTYLHTGLKMRAGVVLQGEDRDTAILHYIGTGGDGTLFGSKGDGVTVGKTGFASLTFTADTSTLTRKVNLFTLGHPWNTANQTASRFFVYNSVADFPLDDPNIGLSAVIGAKEDVLFLDNEFTGYEMGIYSPFIERKLTARNNSFDIAQGNIFNAGAKRMVIEGNHGTGHLIPGVTEGGNFRGIKFGIGSRGWNAEEIYMASNTIEGVGSEFNDGETLLMENPGSNFAQGEILEATSTTATLGVDLTVAGKSWTEQWNIVIVEGKGLGQLRTITNYSNHVATVDEPWTIVPDRTSKFSVLRMARDVVLTDNVTLNSRGGIQVYHNTYDAVIADNVSDHTQGISLWGRDSDVNSPEPVYFIQVKRNALAGASPHFGTTWAGVNAALGGGRTHIDVIIVYGAEFKDNSINRQGSENVATLRGVPAAMPIAFRTPTAITGTGVLATLLEGNQFSHSGVGILLSPGVDASFLKNNTFSSVDEPVRDEAANTVDW
ncbi:glycosyl hydrolase family 28-related protein [Paenibacillus sp. 1P07SE]|uniref:glycosyl hydrolase family 28-related protein n=1 Tax=Paenibacillus sp. 1P07SE TaxID=3132209 RepID=UPI0039A68FC9